MEIDFLKPAQMDDVLDIVTAAEEVKGASITMHQKVMRGEELLIEARVQVAFVSRRPRAADSQAVADRNEGRSGQAVIGWRGRA